MLPADNSEDGEPPANRPAGATLDYASAAIPSPARGFRIARAVCLGHLIVLGGIVCLQAPMILGVGTLPVWEPFVLCFAVKLFEIPLFAAAGILALIGYWRRAQGRPARRVFLCYLLSVGTLLIAQWGAHAYMARQGEFTWSSPSGTTVLTAPPHPMVSEVVFSTLFLAWPALGLLIPRVRRACLQ